LLIPLRNSRVAYLRSACFEALAINRSEKAEKMLIKLAGSSRSNIRNMATAAFANRTEIIEESFTLTFEGVIFSVHYSGSLVEHKKTVEQSFFGFAA